MAAGIYAGIYGVGVRGRRYLCRYLRSRGSWSQVSMQVSILDVTVAFRGKNDRRQKVSMIVPLMPHTIALALATLPAVLQPLCTLFFRDFGPSERRYPSP